MVVGVFVMFESVVLVLGEMPAVPHNDREVFLLYSVVASFSIVSRKDESEDRVGEFWLPVVFEEHLQEVTDVIGFLFPSQRAELVEHAGDDAELDGFETLMDVFAFEVGQWHFLHCFFFLHEHLIVIKNV